MPLVLYPGRHLFVVVVEPILLNDGNRFIINNYLTPVILLLQIDVINHFEGTDSFLAKLEPLHHLFIPKFANIPFIHQMPD